MTAAVPSGSVVLQGFMTPHPSMHPENRKVSTETEKIPEQVVQSASGQTGRPAKGGVKGMNRLQ